ncbi:hypothetical protein B296_00026062 [Ensete ventricosum]|uniref:Uncharacterized protein n=1 Tax=Ensete ventricosum TaxID=4639 RepID=A0A426X8R8_ENSVE|nr:hypothetical protein B296_00026062 [Ensete ventricosum]
MCLITHNRIYVCIGASLCPVIVDLVIIDSMPYPSFTLTGPPSLCQGAATPATGAIAPTGGMAGRRRQPLASWPQSSCPRVATPCRGPGRGQPPLHADNMHVAAPPP